MPDSKDKFILSIDLGTSGSKTALANVYGEIIGFDFQGVPLHHLPDGGVEQDPDDWWMDQLKLKVITSGNFMTGFV